MTRRATGLATLVALLLSSLLSPVSAADPPASMAAAGDSITRAFNTCRFVFTDCPANSWSTGTSTTVDSHYLRIRRMNSAINGKAWNDARSGARMEHLSAQMGTISARNVEYVTVQMGGNDICTPSVDEMTDAGVFADQFRSAMATISASASVETVYVTSIPNAYHLWEIFKGDRKARSTWDRYDVCQSLLANPLSTHPSDEQRRTDVRLHNIALNQALEDVCTKEFADTCVWDGWAIYCTAFEKADITTRDYFHPSVAGQARFAAVSWSAGPFAGVPSPYLGADCVP